MTGIVNLISSRLDKIDLTQPLSVLDLLVAVILVVSFLLYIRRFPVFRVVLGTIFLLFCSVVFFAAGLTLTALLFGIIGNLIIISLPLIFAPEIRHYLEKLGRFAFFRLNFSSKARKQDFIRNLVDSAYELAERKIGATIVLQRRTGLGETIESGIALDAKFGSKLLQNIFFPKSPLHDGAVVIKDERIVSARCLLPISSEIKLDTTFGTRHRAGLSLTFDTDAVVVLVSEQRGEVSLAENGKLDVNLERSRLSTRLEQLL